MITLGATAAALYADIKDAGPRGRLDAIGQVLWVEHGRGRLADHEAQFLAETIAAMRGKGMAAPRAGSLIARCPSRFRRRHIPRSPDRERSRARRRQLGGSGALPDPLRQEYTEGQRSVLTVIAGEVQARGFCDLPIDRIAALAGVCRTTVQTTLYEAGLRGHLAVQRRPRPGQKSLPNLVTITSAEWLVWLRRGPRRRVTDRVQKAGDVQNSEPHEEARGIEEGVRAKDARLVQAANLPVGHMHRASTSPQPDFPAAASSRAAMR